MYTNISASNWETIEYLYQMDGDVKNIKWKVASLKARAGDLADVVGGGGLTSYGIEQCDQLYCMGQKL